MTSVDELLRLLLLYVLLPLWLVAGFADYLCHRRQRIEFSAGWRESLLHLLMLAELGLGVAAALLLEVNAGVLALVLACCVAHELTTWADLSYANARRRIPAVEQWVHAWQLALPWWGLLGLALLHRQQALAAVGMDGGADWALRWKQTPLSPDYLLCVLLAATALAVVPLLDEWRRGRRAAALPGPRADRAVAGN